MLADDCRVLVTGGSGFIGTHLVEYIIRLKLPVLNLDVKPPKLSAHLSYHSYCDIKDSAQLRPAIGTFRPTHVVHLAAKADLNGRTLDDFPDNVIGTKTVIDALAAHTAIRHLVAASTQYVVTPGKCPQRDDELEPYTAYGESKAEAERIVRAASISAAWTIVRPTNVWGPWHPHFPHELWRYLGARVYIHPGHRSIRKYYAYVENVVSQIIGILNYDRAVVDRRVFYLSDPPIDSWEWMNAFSLALAGKPARRAPRSVWYTLALAGDAAKLLGVRSPVSLDRYFRLTVDENIPLERTLQLLGPPSVTLAEGVRRSVTWYRQQKFT